MLRLLRREGLLAPQRVRGRRKPHPHDGTIIPEAPNVRWGTDATMAWTRTDGWVWVFACVDHYTAEAWAHVAKIGDRFAALQPVYDAVVDRWGRLDADIARSLDWGPQYRSAHFTGSLAWLGIADSPAFLGEPETNGCAERWIRTLKDQCLRTTLHDTIDELRRAVAGFVDRLQQLLAHPTARPSNSKGGLPGCTISPCGMTDRPRICPRDRVLFTAVLPFTKSTAIPSSHSLQQPSCEFAITLDPEPLNLRSTRNRLRTAVH